ncbi:MAG: bifunctional phosphopantothenoylcysteine decarboxylase/phosphopantothenate--cysteine ligase CoaBC [Clostridiales bacterium]|nr:bifunctional phosphopantothenoylcysteine decarboxylase/phosphopantothenate--cysteine ligase CoaBC [Clostridiales bacterium]
MLRDKHIVLGVSGGIAAYKACDLVSRLKKQGAQVRVVMTKNACEFVAPLSFETLSGERAYTDQFDRKFEIEHVALAKWADCMLVAPATANVIAKFACGIADDLLSTTYLAMTAPVMLAPAMNTAMWKNAATQANAAVLKARGVRFVGPARGHLACGDEDIGRMSEPSEIVTALEALFSKKQDLAGRSILVTAGPTVERIDPVRYITNRSTGKMGYAIAEAAAARGASVTLVSGPTALDCPAGVARVAIESSGELCKEVTDRAAEADAVIQAAAPADFTPEVTAKQKIKKTGDEMVLKLVPTTDIAARLGESKRPGQVLVAFAAETNDLIENARGKLDRKNADLIVANDVTKAGAGFGTDTNIVTLITRDDMTEYPIMTKREAADLILDTVLSLWGAR